MSVEHDELVLDLIDAPDFEYGTQSGRAVSDERGNMIWEWQTAPGVYTREITQQQLSNLSTVELELQDVQPVGETVRWSRGYEQRHRNKVDRTDSRAGFDFFLSKLGLST
ncbi:MAG: hypothetical protein AB7F79_06815 [Steroidobacteraceae bacterium]